MGQTQVTGTDPANPAFVIPRNIYYTPHQLSIMIETGQQPGVPFHVNPHGTSRPVRPLRKINISSCPGVVHKSSFKILNDGQGKFTVTLDYDCAYSFAANLYIYFMATEAGGKKDIKISGSNLTWGPYPLEAGIKKNWNSQYEALYGDMKHFVGHGKRSDYTAAIVVLEFKSSSSTKNQAKIQKQALYYEFKKRLRSKSPEFTAAGSLNLTCVSSRILIENYGVFVTHDIFGMERSPRPTAVSSPRGKSETSDGEDDDNTESKSEASNVPATTSLVSSNSSKKTVAPSPQEEESKGYDDGIGLDSTECVICLTDPREIGVYPCRHLSMCVSCAEALPTHANKCPICRMEALLLFKIPVDIANGSIQTSTSLTATPTTPNIKVQL